MKTLFLTLAIADFLPSNLKKKLLLKPINPLTVKKVLAAFLFITQCCYLPAQSPVLFDIYPGSVGSLAQNFTTLNNQLLVSVHMNNYQQIWQTDGTQSGTSMVKMVEFNNPDPHFAVKLNNRAVFTGWNYGNYNPQPWVTDGTSSGTFMLKDIFGSSTTGSFPVSYTVFKNNIYFSALDTTYTLSGNEIKECGLWKTDGTPSGTLPVYSYKTSLANFNSWGVQPSGYTEFGDSLYFMTYDSALTVEIWVTNGTTTGTHKLMNNPAGAKVQNSSTLFVLDTALYFYTNMNMGIGSDLWRIDTALDTAWRLNLFLNADFWIMASFNHNFYVVKKAGAAEELWVTDGTTLGTTKLAVLNPVGISNSVAFTPFNNNLLFLSNDGVAPCLWVTDGTPSGTQKIKSFSSAESPGWETIEYNGNIYFVTVANIIGLKTFWRTDGTPQGTVSWATEIGNHSGDASFAVMNGSLYFDAELDNHGAELWKLATSANGIDELMSVTSTNIFPNPASSTLTISNIEPGTTIAITNLLGEIVIKDVAEKGRKEIDVSSLPAGMYFINNRKFVKQ